MRVLGDRKFQRGFLFIAVGLLFGLSSGWHAHAQSPQSFQYSGRAGDLLKRELEKKYVGARVEVVGSLQWVRGAPGEIVETVNIINENSRGEVQFVASGPSQSAEGRANFSAWIQAPIATRRIFPGEKLSKDLFQVQEINVASGMAREYRGAILSVSTDFSKLEARQTILEGQFPLVTGTQRVPDVRRGDPVRVELQNGNLTVSSQGIAAEPAYLDGRIRVLAGKNKRELSGILRESGVVEVQL